MTLLDAALCLVGMTYAFVIAINWIMRWREVRLKTLETTELLAKIAFLRPNTDQPQHKPWSSN